MFADLPPSLLVVAGLALLLWGGDWLVRGAVAVAERLGLPPLVIGLTLVGFGTSMPELLTSVQGALAGAPGIALGNVVGSNIANILLILAVAALIRPIEVERAAFGRDAAVLAVATLAVAGLILAGSLGRIAGTALVAGLLAYLVWTLRTAPPAQVDVLEAEAAAVPHAPARLRLALGAFAAGLVLVLLGARLLVDGAVTMAQALGVSEAVIGLTIVAIGTSLPELVTSAMAARRGESGVAYGNVIGSNIFNLLGILGVTAWVAPLAVPAEIAARDVWVLLGATLALIWIAASDWRVTRVEAVAMLTVFAGYMVFLAVAG